MGFDPRRARTSPRLTIGSAAEVESDEPMFLGEKHPVSGRRGTFEDDGTSAWLYLSEPETGRVIADACAYNRVPPPPASQVGSFRPGPPPAAEGYAGPSALCPDPAAHHWELLWSADGESLAVLRDGTALALIARGGRPGFSRLLAKAGPWGAVWDEGLFRAVMGEAAESDVGADNGGTKCKNGYKSPGRRGG